MHTCISTPRTCGVDDHRLVWIARDLRRWYLNFAESNCYGMHLSRPARVKEFLWKMPGKATWLFLKTKRNVLCTSVLSLTVEELFTPVEKSGLIRSMSRVFSRKKQEPIPIPSPTPAGWPDHTFFSKLVTCLSFSSALLPTFAAD